MSVTNRIAIPAAVYAEMLTAARAAVPLEACGILAGNDGRVAKFYPMTNADASPTHFSLLPAEQFAAIKDMRKYGIGMLGVWHSHPATPARMSEEDLRLALTPGVAYLISSLAPTGLRGYVVVDGKPEEIEIDVASE